MSKELVREREAMVRGMSPRLQPGEFVFCTTTDSAVVEAALASARGHFRETEGWSLLLPVADARRLGFDDAQPMRCLTLEVNSALDGVGLTAAVASALAAHDIPCNMVAAFHHDHVFVPASQAEPALGVLLALQERG